MPSSTTTRCGTERNGTIPLLWLTDAFGLEPVADAGFLSSARTDVEGVRIEDEVLDYVGIDYHLRDFADIQAARGF